MPATKVMKSRAAAKKSAFKYIGVDPVVGAVGKYYPAEDIVAAKGPTPVRNAPKVRGSITPGTVLILLAGRFRGKRVVCLKQLDSGLLLVSGPYTFNGVPLRRVNQKYVIATSTKVEVAGVDVSKVTDATFKRNLSAEKKAATATDLDASVAKATTVSQERLALQKSVDAALEKNVAKVDMLKDYLKARFTLSNNDKPHMMKW